ncbi:ethanolamine ammonia-lyase reactivating factor EutA [Bacillus songklensis]|uniref:Ethanolamine ammonia-lyase reactivating factor EutA n=1 Tax=Bacillus songklensis TaxID=1069116 RepID=A0ABV8B705_9BACI
MEEEWITSVGIDIGTSTSKFIVSRLKLSRVSSHFALPRFQITERMIYYTSSIIPTPLQERDDIDMASLSKWLEFEYRQANIDLNDVQTGAVIITGETALKRNAEKILHYLAERSGDFVVGIAGASLEGVLAGKGSGAYERSLQIAGAVANIDIGGGTANAVIFERGKTVGTITFRIGGRLIEIDSYGEIQFISPSIVPWLEEKGYRVQQHQTITFDFLKEILSHLCKDMLDCLSGKVSIRETVSIVHSTTLESIPYIQELMISGGVGELLNVKEPSDFKASSIYQDIGPVLAHELKKAMDQYPFTHILAEQTSRATVIGAGMQSTEISGSTIHIHDGFLPIRNVPVVNWNPDEKILNDESLLMSSIGQRLATGKELFIGHDRIPFAVSIRGFTYCSYEALKRIAASLYKEYTQLFPKASALVVICEGDMAKALGQLLTMYSNGALNIVCVDQIQVEHGDYIDIGEPIHTSTMVPVVVKTLAFS